MTRFVIRRNWVRLLVWVLVVVGLFAYVGSYYGTLFSTQKSLDDFASLSDTPSIKALTGLAAIPNTLGGAVWTKIWMTCALALAFGVIFLVTRNGRSDEETGRAELLRSRMLGLHASSVASYAVLTLLCLVCGVGVSLASIGTGLDPAGAGILGSLVVGASVAGVAFVFLGVAAVSGQIASTGRGANTIASAVLAVFYVLRMVGDLNGSFLTWLSPIGWGEKMEPYGADNWAPLAMLLVLGGVLVAVALRLEARRDHGQGLVADRPGPADGAASLGSPLGLALRLQRGSIIGWGATIVLSALLFGSVISAMTDLLADSEQAAKIIGGSGQDALVSMLVMIIAMVVAVFALQSAMQLRSDEASGIIEPQLAGAVSRVRWAVGRLAIPVVGSVILLLVGGALMGASYAAAVGDGSQVARLALAALAYWPAVMTLVGVAVLLFGWVPRLSVPITWALLAAVWFLALIGDALNLPTWFLDSTPFAATPYLPMEAMSWMPLIVMVVLTAVFFAVGLGGFRRRDIEVG